MKTPRIALAILLSIGAPRVLSSQAAPDHPFVLSSTYWGGSSIEDFATVAVDRAGNVYVAGTTLSGDFRKTIGTLPALGGADVFISKFDRAGNLVFSTTFGGSASDRVNAIAVDADGNIIIVGDTISPDLPVLNAIQPAFHQGFCGEFGGICSDVFVTKIDPTGQRLIFSTYLGSPRADNGLDVAVDGAGDVYVTGLTESLTIEGASPLREFGGGRDAFVARIPAAGRTFTYFTFLGGTQDESGNGIAVDDAGNAYVTGGTASLNYPTVTPIQASAQNSSTSAFVTKLDPTGAIAYSTYLGGHASDTGVGIAVDRSGAAYVAGTTSSTNFPTVNPQQTFLRGDNDVFVAKLNPSGSSLVYSTYLGGNNREQVFVDFAPNVDIAVDAAGHAYVSGTTQSANFPAVYPLQLFSGGNCVIFPFRTEPCPDAFVSKLDPEGRIVFSTPIGGVDDDRGRGVAVGSDGVVNVVGTTRSINFPLTSPLQPALSGTSDAFIVRISTTPPACQTAAPVLLSPAGGIFDGRPTFSWQAVAGAETYAVLVSQLPSVILGTPLSTVIGVTTGTTLPLDFPFPDGDYMWTVVPWNRSCGLGQPGHGNAFTLPGTCPMQAATQLAPVADAVVDNPVRLEWRKEGAAPASLSVVVIRGTDGRLAGQYATADSAFTLPITLSLGDYEWFVLTWNSTCGAAVSGPARFRSSGLVP